MVNVNASAVALDILSPFPGCPKNAFVNTLFAWLNGLLIVSNAGCGEPFWVSTNLSEVKDNTSVEVGVYQSGVGDTILLSSEQWSFVNTLFAWLNGLLIVSNAGCGEPFCVTPEPWQVWSLFDVTWLSSVS